MAFDISAIRAQLAVELATVTTGWETYDRWPDNPQPPCAIVLVGDGDYHRAMGRGSMMMPAQVALLVSDVVTDEAQADLDAFLSSGAGQDKSVVDVLQGSNLNGTCHEVHVPGWSQYGAVEMPNETRLLGAVLNLEIYCDRK